jgi:hypothetical protein
MGGLISLGILKLSMHTSVSTDSPENGQVYLSRAWPHCGFVSISFLNVADTRFAGISLRVGISVEVAGVSGDNWMQFV